MWNRRYQKGNNMYGLPRDFDASFLVGREVEVVCFAQYNVYLHFDGKISITIESAFSYKTDQVVDVQVPLKESNLTELPGASVVAARGDEDGTLTLVFNNGQTLKVYEDDKHYECYHIAHGEKEIHV
jgi:hypothetical protein